MVADGDKSRVLSSSDGTLVGMSDRYPSEGAIKTEAQAKATGPTIETASFTLTVAEGPDAGKSLVIDAASPSRMLVGQSSVCQLKLTDKQVSRRHFAIEVGGDRLRVTDLGSTNGTLVNGVGVVDAYVNGTDTIHIGATTIRVSRAATNTTVAISNALSFGKVVGASPEMRKLYPLCARVASTDVPVIIEGETGTGKEALAESIHEASKRAKGPFVVFDCTAVPPNLLESALFGHEKGAFTGAVSQRKGVFELADGGTLLIDEIGDLDIALQPKLLRAIERSEIQRVGSEKWVKVDIRVLAATRRDLDHEIQEGRFRDDLFFRLAVARIELPPLRKRQGDITVLAKHFWKILGGDLSQIPYEAIERFEDYGWPGNVRELYNAVLRLVALGELAIDATRARADGEESASGASEVAGADSIQRVIDERLPFPKAKEKIVSEFERRYVESLVEMHGGSVQKAAAASGLALRYFQMIRARHRE